MAKRSRIIKLLWRRATLVVDSDGKRESLKSWVRKATQDSSLSKIAQGWLKAKR